MMLFERSTIPDKQSISWGCGDTAMRTRIAGASVALGPGQVLVEAAKLVELAHGGAVRADDFQRHLAALDGPVRLRKGQHRPTRPPQRAAQARHPRPRHLSRWRIGPGPSQAFAPRLRDVKRHARVI